MSSFQLESNPNNKNLGKVIGANILIFFIYYAIGFTIFKINSEKYADGLLTNGNLILNVGFMLHALILLILAFLPSTVTKGQTRTYIAALFFTILFGIGGIVFHMMIDPTTFMMF